ncbi:hypothetical protein BH11GEM2_BH11GEM2_33640 [soil metagenome]
MLAPRLLAASRAAFVEVSIAATLLTAVSFAPAWVHRLQPASPHRADV